MLTRIDNIGIEVVKCCDSSFKFLSFPLIGGYQSTISKFNHCQITAWTTYNDALFTTNASTTAYPTMLSHNMLS